MDPPHVVHVDFKSFLLNVVCKDMVHEGLKHGWGITEAKKHDCRFKKACWSNKHHLPLVLLSDPNVVVAPSYVELGKYGGVLHVINEFRNNGQRICIPDSMGV